MIASPEMIRDRAALPRPAAPPRSGRTGPVVVASGSRRAGTAEVTALLGLAASQAGRRVLLVDGHPGGGALHRILGTATGPGLDALADAGIDPKDLVRPLGDTLHLLATGTAVAQEADSVTRREALYRRLAPLGDAYDLVLVDAGALLEDVMAPCAAGARRVLLVTTRERATLTATYALVKVLEGRHPGLPAELLVNRDEDEAARPIHRELDGASKHFLGRGVGYAGALPNDDCLRAGLAAGMHLFDAAAGSPAALAAGHVADHLMRQIHPEPRRFDSGTITIGGL